MEKASSQILVVYSKNGLFSAPVKHRLSCGLSVALLLDPSSSRIQANRAVTIWDTLFSWQRENAMTEP